MPRLDFNYTLRCPNRMTMTILVRSLAPTASAFRPILATIIIESQLGTLRKCAVGAWHVACGWVIYVCDIL